MTRSPFIWLLCALLGLALALSPAIMAGIHAGEAPVAESVESAVQDVGHSHGHADAHDRHGYALAPHTVVDCGLFCNHCLAGPLVLPPGAVSFVSPSAVATSLAWSPAPLERLERPPRV